MPQIFMKDSKQKKYTKGLERRFLKKGNSRKTKQRVSMKKSLDSINQNSTIKLDLPSWQNIN